MSDARIPATARLERLEGRLGAGIIELATHAAVPVALNSELVHLLRINFFLDPPGPVLPYSAEWRLLLSPLCRELDEGLYDIDQGLRTLLLRRLTITYGRQRIRDVATLLWEYCRRAPWPDRPELERAQQLTALACIDPYQARGWIAEKAPRSGEALDTRWFVAMQRDVEDLQANTPSPPAVTAWDAERLTAALRRLNFAAQLNAYQARPEHGPPAFVISGPPGHGQRWLSYLLATRWQGAQTATLRRGFAVLLRVSNGAEGALSFDNDMAAQLAVEPGEHRGATWRRVAQAVAARLNAGFLVTFVVDGLDRADRRFVSDFISDFWYGVLAAHNDPDRLWRLQLLMLDEQGHTIMNGGVFGPDAPEYITRRLVRLPALQAFNLLLLEGWLATSAEDLPPELVDSIPQTARDILDNSDDGIPERALEYIAWRCGVAWADVLQSAHEGSLVTAFDRGGPSDALTSVRPPGRHVAEAPERDALVSRLLRALTFRKESLERADAAPMEQRAVVGDPVVEFSRPDEPSVIEDVIRQAYEALATEYEETRNAERASNERTAKMTRVVERIQRLASPPPELLDEFSRSPSPGLRLAAIVALERRPDAPYLNWLADRLGTEQWFVGYWASMALLKAATELELTHLSDMRYTLEKAREGALESGDPNQTYLVKQADRVLNDREQVIATATRGGKGASGLFKQLHGLLLQAFPTVADLQGFLFLEMNEHLATITSTDASLSTMVLDVVRWADSRGLVGELLQAAARSDPTSLGLRDLASHFSTTDLKAESGQNRGPGRPPVQEEPLARGSGVWKWWENGSVLRVRFLDGDQEQHKFVASTAAEWFRYANLTLRVADAGSQQPAEIRVSLKGAGTWSAMGVDALGASFSPDKPTMNFDGLSPEIDMNERRTAVLHNFGHALGLIHEHQNPSAQIPWNREVIYQQLGRPPNNWDRKTVDSNMFKTYTMSELGSYRAFDPHSVMMYSFPAEWRTDGVEMKGGTELSPSDISFIMRVYPRDTPQ